MKKEIFLFISLIALSGCASNTGIIKSGTNKFFIEKQQATSFSGLGNIRADVYNEANLHCSALNGRFQEIRYRETQPPYILGNYPRVSLDFSC